MDSLTSKPHGQITANLIEVNLQITASLMGKVLDHICCNLIRQLQQISTCHLDMQAQLLMRVHHRNLASFIGYCNDGTNLGIIYEYMAGGNLQQYLQGIGHVNLQFLALFLEGPSLPWMILIQIQFLKYLRNTCFTNYFETG